MTIEFEMSASAHDDRTTFAERTGGPSQEANVELGYQRILVSDWLEKAGLLHVEAPKSKAKTL